MTHPFLIIEGVIGVGKTSLARLLQPHFEAEVLMEVFEENPFLADFYTDRARYAFQTQMFFLLSRYRQQHQTVPATLQRTLLISDYMFAKDRLFARLNLCNDELGLYERLHDALAEKIPAPTLMVYLRASTDTLMARIATRDRPYERQMDRDYIEMLREAYDAYFSQYSAAPVLVIDTDERDFVRSLDDLVEIEGRVRAALELGAQQQSLPGTEGIVPGGAAPVTYKGADSAAWKLTSHFLQLTAALGQIGANLDGYTVCEGADAASLDRAIRAAQQHLTDLDHVRRGSGGSVNAPD